MLLTWIPPPFLLQWWICASRGCEICLWVGVVITETRPLAPCNFSSSFLFAFQSRKHASKVRLYYMLHPIDGGCPAKKLRSENVSIAPVPVYSAALTELFVSLTLGYSILSLTATDDQVPRGNI